MKLAQSVHKQVMKQAEPLSRHLQASVPVQPSLQSQRGPATSGGSTNL